MGCSTSSPAVTDTNTERTPSANKVRNIKDNSNMDDKEKSDDKDSKKYPASEAFIIPLNEEGETQVYNAGAPEAKDLLAATVRKQPPKRIQELIEQAAENEATAVNLQDLEEKLEKAEERRKEYLQQKIINVQKTTQQLMGSGSKGLLEKGDEEDDKRDNQNDKAAEQGE